MADNKSSKSIGMGTAIGLALMTTFATAAAETAQAGGLERRVVQKTQQKKNGDFVDSSSRYAKAAYDRSLQKGFQKFYAAYKVKGYEGVPDAEGLINLDVSSNGMKGFHKRLQEMMIKNGTAVLNQINEERASEGLPATNELKEINNPDTEVSFLIKSDKGTREYKVEYSKGTLLDLSEFDISTRNLMNQISQQYQKDLGLVTTDNKIESNSKAPIHRCGIAKPSGCGH